MTTTAKKVSDMDAAEYKNARGGVVRDANAAAIRKPNTQMLWDDVAATIRGMSQAEMKAFSDRYGISIMSQDTAKMKKYSAMTPEEKEAFLILHGIEGVKEGGK